MPASLLWFHDHGLGATRLNVFAGLAAAYILRDEFDTGTEPNPIGIPGGAYEIPLVIQDRQFNPDGTFLYPTSDIPGATWIGEYFGDVMLVNGKVWPFLEVEPRMYRFRILNGCNARILNLDIGGPRPVADRRRGRHVGQAGAGEGVGARARPSGRTCSSTSASSPGSTTGDEEPQTDRSRSSTPAPSLEQVMQIRVGTTVSQPGPTTIPASLPGRAADLPEPGRGPATSP